MRSLMAFGLNTEETYPMLSPFLPLPSPETSPDEAESMAGTAQAAANKSLYNMLAIALRVLADCEVITATNSVVVVGVVAHSPGCAGKSR